MNKNIYIVTKTKTVKDANETSISSIHLVTFNKIEACTTVSQKNREDSDFLYMLFEYKLKEKEIGLNNFPESSDAVVDMTKKLFPGCKVEKKIIKDYDPVVQVTPSGSFSYFEEYVLIQVINCDEISEEKRKNSLIQWHTEIFSVEPNLPAGTYRIQLD